MTDDERNPKPEYRKILRDAWAGFVIGIFSFIRISSLAIRHSDPHGAVHGEPPFAFCAYMGTMNAPPLPASGHPLPRCQRGRGTGREGGSWKEAGYPVAPAARRISISLNGVGCVTTMCLSRINSSRARNVPTTSV